MSWQFILKLLALMQMLHLSVSSHVQLAEDQQHLQQQQELQLKAEELQPEVNATIGHLPLLATAAPLTHLYDDGADDNSHRRSHIKHNPNRRHHHHPQHDRESRPQHFHHWHNGQKVHRVYAEDSPKRRHHHHSHHSGRWSPRRRHHHRRHYVPWSPWSSCSPDCIKRRERLCRAKRKCGHTKHIEERKCWRCHPATDDGKWSTTSSSLTPHETTGSSVAVQHTLPPYSHNTSPTIIINAAAAAAAPAPIAATTATTSGGVIHLIQPTSPGTPTELDQKHHPVVASEELISHHVVTHTHDTEDDGDDESDFYVIKAKRRRRKPPPSPPPQHQREPWLPYSAKDFPLQREHDVIDEEQDEDALNELGSAMPPNQLLETSASDVRPIAAKLNRTLANTKFRQNHHERQGHRHHHQHQHQHQHQREHDERKLKGAGGSKAIDGASEGDVFQYDDFDIDIGVGHDEASNQYADMSYDDSGEYNEYRNATGYSPQKERATPEHLIPRHRRIYSKWSRWTKCTPKCTTRRYKKCRVREQCGREVLREIAYCYTEGSFCQQWLQAQVQKSPAYELRPIASRRRDVSDSDGTLSNSIVSDFIMNGKGYRGPEYTPMKLKCGIAPIRSNRRNMYNMLKIIGGKAARKGEWPWQVAIFNRFKEAFCGGTLIAPQWVLTAAHCVRKVLYVRLGEHNLDYEDGTELHLKVLKSFKHPNFDKKTVDSDVALLKLPKPVNTTTWIGFSCLPKPYQPLPKNLECTVIGWGKRRNRDVAGTSVLHQAEVPIIPMDNCRSVYFDYTITKNMFCAGHKRGRIDTCAGDSGGPLLCRDTTKPNHPWTIFGITSFGDGCAKRNKFGIYAKVPNYVDWVWSVINCNGNCKMHQRS